MIVDLFAGPGGWSEGLRTLGHSDVGIELDEWACKTRAAASHPTIRADVTNLPLDHFRDVEGLIASPPCPAFSTAGKKAGATDGPRLLSEAAAWAQGPRPIPEDGWAHPESPLMLEVIRWIHDLEPNWVACEQVPPILGFWEVLIRTLETWGYSAWAGVLLAADYGVPQTRRRAFLMASRGHRVAPPPPTHSKDGGGLFGGQRWITMADALGWDGEVGFPRLDDQGDSKDGYRERDWRPTDRPAQVVTEKARSWQLRTHLRPDIKTGDRDYQRRRADQPAPPLHGSIRSWAWERPATTVMGDPRVHPTGANAIRVSVPEAAILQGFRPDYPFQGTRTAQFRQVGNAVPPPLAAAVLSVVLPVGGRG